MNKVRPSDYIAVCRKHGLTPKWRRGRLGKKLMKLVPGIVDREISRMTDDHCAIDLFVKKYVGNPHRDADFMW